MAKKANKNKAKQTSTPVNGDAATVKSDVPVPSSVTQKNKIQKRKQQSKVALKNEAKAKQKGKGKMRSKEAGSEQNEIKIPAVRRSDEKIIVDDAPNSTKWINKQRLLVVASRGITYRDRHLMNDLKKMMPHCKSEPKIDTKDPKFALNEVCEIRNCNKCIFFENRRREDLYMWIANVPNGPTCKFLVENVHSMDELRMHGNCLKASRPLLSFDVAFDREPHYRLLRELLAQIFGVPNAHPKSQPFFDHVFSFTIMDNRVWFRNYQIVNEHDGSLSEIGPRFDLNLIKIFADSFGGPVLYSNPEYVSPNKHRIALKHAAARKYRDRIDAKRGREISRPKDGEVYADVDVYDDVFVTIPPEQAIGKEKLVFQRKK